MSICWSLLENIAYKFIFTLSAVASMSYLNGLWDVTVEKRHFCKFISHACCSLYKIPMFKNNSEHRFSIRKFIWIENVCFYSSNKIFGDWCNSISVAIEILNFPLPYEKKIWFFFFILMNYIEFCKENQKKVSSCSVSKKTFWLTC